MSKDSRTSFLARLERSNLLAPEVMAQVREEFADGDPPLSAPEIANRLVARQLLTHWQADMLLEGRSGFFFGKYKLLDRLGRGGMGSVFKAQKRGMGRAVALKVMSHALMKNPAAVSRFRREIEAAAALVHPQIVAAIDADCADGTHFLVMEFVDGRDLGEISAEHGPLPIDWTCECLRQAAVGLQHAFERGMVHRDIKPSNILVVNSAPDEPLAIKILDMGLARMISESRQEGELTQTGQVMGTPDYIAPEQARNTRSADIRSDIFSLGCTAYKLLTGELPYQGVNVMEKLMARALADAPPLRQHRPDAPAALEAVVAKMLARNPDARYQTPSQVAQALLPFCGYSHIPLPAVETEQVGRDEARAPSDPSLGDPGSSELDQLLAQLATEIQEDSQPEISSPVAPPPLAQAPSGGRIGRRAARAKHPLADASAVLRLSPRELLQKYRVHAVAAGVTLAAILIGVIWQRSGVTELVIEWPPAEREGGTLKLDDREISLSDEDQLRYSGPPGKRSVKLYRPGYETISEEIVLGRGERKTLSPEWIPTKATVRKARLEGLARRVDLSVADARSEAEESLTKELQSFCRAHPATDEADAAAGLLARLRWPIDNLSHEQLSSAILAACTGESPAGDFPELVGVFGNPELAHWRGVWSARMSPDGTTVASGGDDGIVCLWDVAGTKPVRTLRHHTRRIMDLAFHPQGRLLVTAGDDGAFVYDIGSDKVVRRLSGHTGGVRSAAFSPDGTLIATGSLDRTVKLWKTEDGALASTLEGFRDQVTAVDFSPDSKRLAAASYDGAIRIWQTADAETTAPQLITMDGERIEDVCFARDDASLAFATQSGSAYVLELNAGNPEPELFQRGGAASVAFSPDGKSIVVGQSDGNLQLWNRGRLDQRNGRRIKVHTQWVGSVSFIDERRILSASRDGSVRITNVTAPRKNDELPRGTGPVTSLAFHPNGRTLVSGGSDRMIREWDVATGTELRRFGSHKHNVTCLVYTFDGRRLFSSCWDGEVCIWDVFAGKKHLDLPRHPAHPLRMALHPAGKPLAVAVYQRDDQVKLWDPDAPIAPEVLATAPQTHCVAFAPDGTLIACGSTELELWDTGSRKKLAVLDTLEKDVYHAVAFSPDGRTVAGGKNSRTIELYDVAERRRTRTLFGHEHLVDLLAFSPDGSLLASCAWDGRVILWDPATGQVNKQFKLGPRDSQIQHIAFSPDGRHLATANANGTIYILRLRDRE
jgi:WD40 repeat protein/serine/threonine protein kinase